MLEILAKIGIIICVVGMCSIAVYVITSTQDLINEFKRRD